MWSVILREKCTSGGRRIDIALIQFTLGATGRGIVSWQRGRRGRDGACPDHTSHMIHTMRSARSAPTGLRGRSGATAVRSAQMGIAVRTRGRDQGSMAGMVRLIHLAAAARALALVTMRLPMTATGAMVRRVAGGRLDRVERMATPVARVGMATVTRSATAGHPPLREVDMAGIAALGRRMGREE
jgi:hypothetical protein